MSKLVIIASLLAACAAASADPKAPPAKPEPVRPEIHKCEPSGSALFESKKTVKTGAGPSETHALYANGAYTSDATDKDGKSTQHITGVCVSDQQLADAKAALKDATWKVTTARIKCMAMSNDITTYNASGKEVFAETLCSGKSLDDKSAAALEKLKDLLKGPAPK